MKRLLIYRFGQIGDTVAALPSLWLLRAQYKEAHFSLLSEIPQQGSHLPPELVLPSQGLVQEFLKFPGGMSLRQIPGLLRTLWQLRKGKFDAVAYLAPSIRSPKQKQRDAWFFRLAGIPKFLAFDGFPDEVHPRASGGALCAVPHEADALLSRLATSGLPTVASGCGRMDLALTDKEREAANKWWVANDGVRLAPNGWFAICAGSKWSSKQWPTENYFEVGRRLIEAHGLLPVVLGGAEDREIGQRLISTWGKGLCAAGDLSVRESAALMQNARFYLGNDTGVMHLAAAVGTRCIGIFSALDWPGRWHPYGVGHEVVRHEVPCAGCLLQTCDKENICLRKISSTQVLKACERVLSHPR